MIVVLRPDIRPAEVAALAEVVRSHGCDSQLISGTERSILAILGRTDFDPRALHGLPGVIQVLRVGRPYKMASREVHPDRTVVSVGVPSIAQIGGAQVVVIAGPPAVEGREMLMDAAARCAELGVTVLRSGAFGEGRSPYAFQGLGEEALALLAEAGRRFNLAICTEVTSPEQVPLVAKYADILQIPPRHMHSAALLQACSRVSGRAVMLERGIAATIDEWLHAAEYILAPGHNPNVILCERGIRTFERATSNTLDLSAVPVLRERTHLPIVVDPSHGTGVRAYVPAMARAAVAAGADGVVIEVHDDPERCLVEGAQTLRFEQLASLIRDLQTIAPVVGRRLDLSTTRPVPVPPVAGAPAFEAQCAFQGERGAFSEKAARQVFGPGVSTLPTLSFRACFEAVESGRAPYGIVPVENTLGGSIHENFDHLQHHRLRIVGETKLRVVHNLIANRGARLADITKIYAHPQAAAQCDVLLREHPEWVVFQVYDTAGSAMMIRDEGGLEGAAIAGADVADEYGMVVLRAGIESHPENYTRFVVIAPLDERESADCGDDAGKLPGSSRANKSSLVFVTRDQPGALAEALRIFASRGVNLTKLESRPIPGRPWDYRFYVDLAAVPDDGLLAALSAHVLELKVLGVYPSA